MDAMITDIQRFSLNDGDGIRTTVFFKGCNMSCTWCHNPETLSKDAELIFYKSKCIGCKKCFSACPNGAHSIKNGEHIIDRSLCKGCGKCAEVCYAEALTMCGKRMTVEAVMNEIRQDISYYKGSNGGVTLSGGEVACHSAFALELTNACHADDIKVAIETNLSLPFNSLKPLLSSVDLIMCDIKIFDDSTHKSYTGISNKNILKNIKLLDSLHIPFIVRTPLIPGATTDIGNISAIADYIKPLKNLVRYELLNFNPLGEGKYKGLSRKNSFESTRPLSDGELDKYKEILTEVGIAFKIV